MATYFVQDLEINVGLQLKEGDSVELVLTEENKLDDLQCSFARVDYVPKSKKEGCFFIRRYLPSSHSWVIEAQGPHKTPKLQENELILIGDSVLEYDYVHIDWCKEKDIVREISIQTERTDDEDMLFCLHRLEVTNDGCWGIFPIEDM